MSAGNSKVSTTNDRGTSASMKGAGRKKAHNADCETTRKSSRSDEGTASARSPLAAVGSSARLDGSRPDWSVCMYYDRESLANRAV
jgi:hypothetical protein